MDSMINRYTAERSMRRISHYDYWLDKIRRSIILDAKADILVYGNAEYSLMELSNRLTYGEYISSLHNIRCTT